LYEDGRCEGGHYFGTIPIPRGGIISQRKEKFGDLEVTVEHESYEEVEYWECDGCYSNG